MNYTRNPNTSDEVSPIGSVETTRESLYGDGNGYGDGYGYGDGNGYGNGYGNGGIL